MADVTSSEHADGTAADVPPLDLEQSTLLLLRSAPSGFVAERRRLAAAADARGDRDGAQELLAIRKPSVAAWALNVLAASRPELHTELARVGAALGAAQQSGDAAALRTLGSERRALVAAFVEAAAVDTAGLGASLSAGVLEAVRQSVQAASADADVAAQLASGRLTDALAPSGAGWGGGAATQSGRPAGSSTPTSRPGDGSDGDAAGDDAADDAAADDDRARRLRARLDVAEREATRAADAQAQADTLLAETTARHTELVRERADLARRLDELDAELAEASRGLARRRREAERTGRAADDAEAAAEALRTALTEE